MLKRDTIFRLLFLTSWDKKKYLLIFIYSNRREKWKSFYQYYFDSEEKVFLYEVYKSNEAAIEHVKNFRGSKWESKFGELFSIENFAVLGEASKDLKKSLEGYTTDFRYLKGGFHKPAKKLSKEIMKLWIILLNNNFLWQSKTQGNIPPILISSLFI